MGEDIRTDSKEAVIWSGEKVKEVPWYRLNRSPFPVDVPTTLKIIAVCRGHQMPQIVFTTSTHESPNYADDITHVVHVG